MKILPRKLFRAFLLLFTICISILSCKKEDFSTVEKENTVTKKSFFSFPSNTNSIVLRVGNEIFQRESAKAFVDAFAAKNGFPVWNKVLFAQKERVLHHNNITTPTGSGIIDTLVYIPLVLENETTVNGYILATITDSINLSFSLAKDYPAYSFQQNGDFSEASKFVYRILKLNQLVFGNDKYKIPDTRLFSKDTLHQKTASISLASLTGNNQGLAFAHNQFTNGLYTETICDVVTVTVVDCGYPQSRECENGCDRCSMCTHVYREEICYDITYEGNGGGGTPGEGGGGGSGGIPHEYPCPDPQAPIDMGVVRPPIGDCPPPVPPTGPIFLPIDDEEPTSPLVDWAHLNNPVIVEDETVEMPPGFNFTFENFSDNIVPPTRVIGRVKPRGNTEDMLSGNNCDASGILNLMPNFTDQQLFDEVEDLFHKTSMGTLEMVGDEMIQRFRNKLGGAYSNPNLSQKVFESNSFKDFVVKFGVQLNNALASAGWNINNVQTIDIDPDRRPKFNGLYNKFHGLQILINDTEETIIELSNFSIHPTTHKWTANINVTIKDHFGLDKNDALTYQNSHAGFAAWWILQHCRGYKPFETQVKFNMNLVAQ